MRIGGVSSSSTAQIYNLRPSDAVGLYSVRMAQMEAQVEYKYDVFISYSHVDRAWVWEELLPRLEKARLKVCIDDRDFEVGVPSVVNMERAADNSRHTIVVLTPAWVQSQWTDFESLLIATTDPAGRMRKLMPLMLELCDPPQRIAILTRINFFQPTGRVDPFNRLLQQLRGTTRAAKLRRSSSRKKSTSQQPQALSTATRPFNEELSPFIAGFPIADPHRFFGRERELKRLFDLWKRSPFQNAAIIGPARSGKTSLLLYLQNLVFPSSPLLPYRWIFVDFQDPRMGSRERLLRHLLDKLDLPIPNLCDMAGFMDMVTGRLQTPTVILLDEVGVALQRYPELDDAFWEGLRALASSQEVGGNLAFALASHQLPVQLAHATGHSSPFFNIFGYTTYLGPLTELEARKLIAISPIPFPPDDVEWILAQSRCWPILLQILCRERFAALQEDKVDDTWRNGGLQQMVPFQHLVEIQ